jgi:hypothetical protein
VSRYPFIEAEKAGQRSVNRAGAVLEVSRAAYDEWRCQQPSRRAQEDQALTEKARVIFECPRQTYGAPRVHQALRQVGTRCSRKRVARLMSEQQLQGRHRRRWKRTTVADPEAEVCWAGDLTYAQAWEGWTYLATAIDLGSWQVVDWAWPTSCGRIWSAMRSGWRSKQRRPRPGLIFPPIAAASTPRRAHPAAGPPGPLAEPVPATAVLGQRGAGVVRSPRMQEQPRARAVASGEASSCARRSPRSTPREGDGACGTLACGSRPAPSARRLGARPAGVKSHVHYGAAGAAGAALAEALADWTRASAGGALPIATSAKPATWNHPSPVG